MNSRAFLALTFTLVRSTVIANPQPDAPLLELKVNAEFGVASAQNTLAVKYANGDGVPKDLGNAFKWFREAAEQGHTAAQFNLGVMYANGDGVPKDSATAAIWFQKAAEAGNDGKQRPMFSRDDSPKNWAHPAYMFFSSASGGSASAQLTLGVLYASGRGVPEDHQ